ncbi:MAG: hypothetical protein GVY24_04655 [Planctomycetes bacterium]|nr:hypothetical protein [Planctomycetota bacterium]
MLILGMDGLDPAIMEVMMEQGLLPAFAQLRADGHYAPLSTVVPPESPVVWSSFATGTNPTDHGIFDFIHRDPNDYSLDLSITRSEPGVGYTNPRGGVAFWKKLADAGVPVRVLFAPCAFPPENFEGHLLAGMGIPDLKGHMGRYVLISSDPAWSERNLQGDLIGVSAAAPRVRFDLPGPLLSGGMMPGSRSRSLSVPVDLRLTKGSIEADIEGQHVRLMPGEWSPWISLTFKRRFSAPIHGICRFYLVSIEPHLQLYCTPIQFDPTRPVFPISNPETFSAELAEQIGLYATLGLPLDTKAYEDGALDAAGFTSMAVWLMEENRRALRETLRGWDEGMVFCYFNTPDPVQHMFWSDALKERMRDQGVAAIPGPIVDAYRRMDAILAEALESIRTTDQDGRTTDLMVLSDHGFADFRYAVELNRLLHDWGYLAYDPTFESKGGGPLFRGVDWSRTRAYACGFTSIYLNLAGRESHGVVTPADRDMLLEQIREKLLAYHAEATGEQVVTDATIKPLDGPFAERSPDLVVGFAPGYRVSWVTALGGIGDRAVEPNPRRWRGDHIVHAPDVPGVVFVRGEHPPPSAITDISGWVLERFSVPADPLRLTENPSR